ncbi:MAG: PP2C family protein-serine/threonine phosphatase [Thermoanaerobaculales bacterium]
MMGDPESAGLAEELASSRERVRRLETVVEAGLMVNSTLDLSKLGEHIIDIATRLIKAERGSLFLVDADKGTLRSMVAQGVAAGSLNLEIGEGIVGAVAASGEAEILNHPYDDPRFDSRVDLATGFRTRSLLTVPVRDREGRLTAVLQLLNRRDGEFSPEDVDFLAELGVPFAIALTTSRMHGEIVARERLYEEVRLAAEIQRTLQPAERASVPGLELEIMVRPCLEVGGDYWDVIPVGEGRWWIVVADVSGKGVPAGLVASNIQACLWSRRDDQRPLAEIVAGTNDLLYRLTQGRKYATLVVVEWEEGGESLSWVSAGHPPLLHETAGEVRELGATGRPIGLLEDQHYECGRVRLLPGDSVLLYTDGVLEAGVEGDAGEFGLDRISACMPGEGGPAGVIARLETAVGAHLGEVGPEDDITMVCLRRASLMRDTERR